MHNVIITGADGFVGSYTVKSFLKHGINVLAIDLPEKPRRLTSDDRLVYISKNVFDIHELKKCLTPDKYDTFIHLAWEGSAGAERSDYHLQMNNAIKTVDLLKLAKSIGCNRFVCAGSIMELEVEATVHSQGSKPGMGYIYGMGKYMAHCMCKSVAAKEGIELIWPMITNAYGVGELSPRFINTTLRKIIDHEPLNFTAAIQNYDFIFVTDVAEAFYLISKHGKPFFEYTIGSGNAKPLKEFIIEMKESLAPNAKLNFGDIPFTGTNLPLDAFSVKQTEKDTGFSAKISFTDGTRMTMEWLKTYEVNNATTI